MDVEQKEHAFLAATYLTQCRLKASLQVTTIKEVIF